MGKKNFLTFLFGALCGVAGGVCLGYYLAYEEINWLDRIADEDEEYEDDEDFDAEIGEDLEAKYEKEVSEVCPNFAE